MKRTAAAGLFIAGIVLLYFGYQEYQSLAPQTPRLFGGTAPDLSIWLMVAGAGSCIAGLAGMLRGGDADQFRL